MQTSKFNIICNTVDNGIIVLNKNLEIQYWNTWLEIRTKVNAKDVLNNKITNLYPNINEQKLQRKVISALKLKSTTFFTSNINKSLIDIELNKVADKVFKNMQQNITITPLDYDEELVIVYIYDTTLLSEINYKLKVQNENFEEKNNQLNLLLNTTMEAIILLKDEKIVKCNDIAVDFFNLKHKNELVNKNISILNLDKNLLNITTSSPREIKLNFHDIKYALINVKQTILNNQSYKILTFLDTTELKKKEKLLQEQAKLASMGEMIGNIAHQWRQPLSIISVAASSTHLKNKFNDLDDEFINSSMKKIMDTTEHLSKTIEVFRGYLKDEKNKIHFNINENINKNLSIIEPILNENNIKIIRNFSENIEIYNFYNELSQVLMNILNNAKDALLLNISNSDERIIKIETKKISNNAIIKITDNALGIDKSIINRIFEPYFTTKHNYHGTGLGLYMSHKLIKNMEGEINVENETFTYNDKIYTGASFIIKLNLD